MNVNVLPKIATDATPIRPVILEAKAPRRTVTGRNIAHARRSPVERALLAADILAGRVGLADLTAKQVAAMLKTNQVYVDAARHLSTAERRLVEAELRPLKPKKRPTPPRDDEVLTRAIHRLGVDRVLEIAARLERVAA